VGTVGLAGAADAGQAIEIALNSRENLSRHDRFKILDRTRQLLLERREEFSRLITSETGLCLKETDYEVGRAVDVFQFASHEALRDDGQVFSCDISPQGKSRKIYTTREPLGCAVCITPFNHPLNTVAHKIAPAIAAGTPVILKPSEKTPLTSLRLAETLYESGLPGSMLSVLLGSSQEVSEKLVQDPRVDLVSFTGSVAVGKKIAATAGYKKIILELGGNDPFIVLEDADLDLAAHLAAEGSFRNSGQRCTAIKRILVQKNIADEFASRLVEKTRGYVYGDPFHPNTRVGTVIDEPAAVYLEHVVQEAVAAGARVLIGGTRNGALLAPTVLDRVPRDCRMVVCESFGPLAPILTFETLEEAIEMANATPYGLSSGVATTNLEKAMKLIRGLRCGTVNINEVPGFRIETTPFGGIKDSGLGIKEGILEAIKCFSFIKSYSLPW